MRISGDLKRPRVIIHRSLKHIYAQAIDDSKNKIIVSLSTLSKDIRQKFPNGGGIKAAQFLGETFADKIKEKGIGRIVFDRAGYLYHGRVKAFADALRKGGIEF